MILPGAVGRGICGVAVLLAGLQAGPALARCSITKSGFVAQDVQMDMGQVTILPGTPVGGVIKELVATINQVEGIGTCTSSGGYAEGRYVNAQQAQSTSIANTYNTLVEGVGIRVYRDSGTVQAYYPHTVPLAAREKNLDITLNGGRFRVELIKTAIQTGSGPIAASGRFTTYYLDGDGPSRPELTSTFKGTGTTVVSPTCEVLAGSRNLVVDFGAVPASTFTGVGSRAVNRDFDIRLSCQGSNLAAYQSAIGIRLDATQDSSNRAGVLRLTQGGNTATRIGIELVQRDGAAERALAFGTTVPLGRTVVGSSAFNLPLRARYIQTQAGAVGPGTANGAATFTITYN
ncbi:type 1 fimbrial protein [Stenotrophomonas sp. ATCM1_4]|uniref:fimbrial protein n=1 Tax=Stenotrophomonas sp. ATCM1_4 TaxID=2259330 RepID=UPI001047A3E5|nr:fimbrial protein [Stenotrophomonas sp. ATCM1_4]TDB28579.1 type 1 fimbrial protein [Stenotrophomonas sp. ATCM1_4]